VRIVAKDVGAKAIACAEKNVQSLLDHVQSLLHAKGLNEVMRLHGEQVQSRMLVTDRAGERNGPARKPGRNGAARPKMGIEKDIFIKYLFIERRGDG
jgi:hypothetical protein